MLGINSFLKGCSSFSAFSGDVGPPDFTVLKQFSSNPSVYSRLSCFLPWIAEQYGLTYTPSQPTEPECEEGVGNIDEVTAQVCRATTTNPHDVADKLEPSCILPFTLDNEVHNECTLVAINDFTRPQFICPIRTVRGRGTNYTRDDSDISRVYCPTISDEGEVINQYNGQWELDPDSTWCINGAFSTGRPVFATCKNTCPGGEASNSTYLTTSSNSQFTQQFCILRDFPIIVLFSISVKWCLDHRYVGRC